MIGLHDDRSNAFRYGVLTAVELSAARLMYANTRAVLYCHDMHTHHTGPSPSVYTLYVIYAHVVHTLDPGREDETKYPNGEEVCFALKKKK